MCVKPVKGGLLSYLQAGPSDTPCPARNAGSAPCPSRARSRTSWPPTRTTSTSAPTPSKPCGSPTAAPAWSFGQGPRPYGQRRYGVPAVRDGVVYANEGARGLVAVDALTGAERWSEIPLKDFRAAPDTTPAVGARYVYAMDMTGLRAIDFRTHCPTWRYPTPATTLTPDPDNPASTPARNPECSPSPWSDQPERADRTPRHDRPTPSCPRRSDALTIGSRIATHSTWRVIEQHVEGKQVEFAHVAEAQAWCSGNGHVH
ncbi:PQQ-binding-like beta-propeller repeat protein [Streptomyces goshikiensis]|uniref:outer membrane protein assembly factor BamB family protein n=1 Tax=Streptomyces goshikiensis TaxID=1942 RepID=UPI00367418F5